ncbi:9036_t:CDS:1 [Gigaspora margarita]|uniref:9036_t:CDS:1 n=1 Tax=Gigaspora margarita TaxID=4874 RepID=A0ABN7V2J3_GIGMA|nr:9036_t:CDS:1 [Gigaspora margarita]
MANKIDFDFNDVAKSEIQELLKFNSNTFLPMKELLYNRSNPKRPPRAQNGFVLFRKDLNAFFRGSSKLTIGKVSRLACKLWNGYPSCKLWENININEIKPFYNKLSEIAKKVHGRSFPGYKYSPKRKSPQYSFFDKFKNLHYANFHYYEQNHSKNSVYKDNNLHCYDPYYSTSDCVFEPNKTIDSKLTESVIKYSMKHIEKFVNI